MSIGNPICAERFHGHYIEQPALLSHYAYCTFTTNRRVCSCPLIFFSIPTFALLFSFRLINSRNSDSGSHDMIGSPPASPLRTARALRFFSREDFRSFSPCRLASINAIVASEKLKTDSVSTTAPETSSPRKFWKEGLPQPFCVLRILHPTLVPSTLCWINSCSRFAWSGGGARGSQPWGDGKLQNRCVM